MALFRGIVFAWFALISVVAILHSLYRLFLVNASHQGNNLVNLVNPGQQNDIGYSENWFVTLLHLLPGILFVLIGPLQFWQKLRNKYFRFHRVLGYTYVLSVLAIVISGWTISLRFPIGGLSEAVAAFLFGTYVLVCVFRAVRFARKKETLEHRSWMLRGYFVVMGIGSARLTLPFFGILGGVSYGEALAISLWLCFSLHAILAEVWINRFFRVHRVSP